MTERDVVEHVRRIDTDLYQKNLFGDSSKKNCRPCIEKD